MNPLNPSHLKSLFHFLLDSFFPRYCFYSHKPLFGPSTYRYIHPSTLSQFSWISSPRCIHCAYPFQGAVESNKSCSNCQDLSPIFQSGLSLFLLRNAGRSLIHNLKYHAAFHLWPDVIKLLSLNPHIPNFIHNSILVPVPLHKKRLLQRGFNQSLLLANALASLSPYSTVHNILLRTKFTQTQTSLPRLARLQNVKNAFALKPNSTIVKNQRYILVDDVFTTGATLNSCSQVLQNAGVKHIDIFTLGHG